VEVCDAAPQWRAGVGEVGERERERTKEWRREGR